MRKKTLSIVLALAMLLSMAVPAFAGYVRTGSSAKDPDYGVGMLNIDFGETEFQFMQTQDNQQFSLSQNLSFQKAKIGAYAMGKSWLLYEGLHYNNTDTTEEYPIIEGYNPTTDFLNEYGGTFDLVRLNDNAQEMTGFPDNGDFAFEGGIFDWMGAKNYNFRWDVSFHGRPNGDYGEIDTGYYWAFSWEYRSSSVSNVTANREIRLGTSIQVTDVRPLIALYNEKTVDSLNANNSAAYRQMLTTVLNTVPADMLNGTTYYTQNEVDAYADALANAGGEDGEDIADYSAYNRAKANADALTNNNNAYDAASFTAYKNQVNYIDSQLVKDLSMDWQSTVDAATQAILDARSLLVANTLSGEDTYHLTGVGSEAGNHDASVDNYDNNWDENNLHIYYNYLNYKFIQTYDDQTFCLPIDLQLKRAGDSTRELCYFTGLHFDTTLPTEVTGNSHYHCAFVPDSTTGNTTDFISRVTSGIVGDEFSNWTKNTQLASSELVESDGTLTSRLQLNGDRVGVLANVLFTGLAENEQDHDLSFTQVLEWETREYIMTAIWDKDHVHLTTTVDITDARALLAAIDNAEALLDSIDEDDYTTRSLNTLRAALAAVPEDMREGTLWYDQAAVDARTASVLAATQNLERKADFTAYDEAAELVNVLLQDNNANGDWNNDAYDVFRNTVLPVLGMDHGLGESKQSDVDAATQTLLDAVAALEENPNLKPELDALIAEAIDLFGNDIVYTDASTQALEDAIQAAQAVSADDDATTQEQRDAYSALNDAVLGIQEKADYTEYDEKKAEIEDIVSNQAANYSPTSVVDDLNNTLVNVDSGLNKDLSVDDQNTVDAAADALQAALDAIAPYKRADYSDLDAAIADAEALLANSGDELTDASRTAIENALDDARNVQRGMTVGENNANQNTIDTAATALQSALDDAKNKADYSEYESVKAQIEDIINNHAEEYVPFSVIDDLRNALETIDNGLDKDLPVEDQALVDAAKNDLITALNNTEQYLDTDRQSLNEAIKEAEDTRDNGTQWTDDSVQRLNDAIDDAKDVLADENATPEEILAAKEAVERETGRLTREGYALVEFYKEDGELVMGMEYQIGTLFEDTARPYAINNARFVSVGWIADPNSTTLIPDDFAITEDLSAYIAVDRKCLVYADSENPAKSIVRGPMVRFVACDRTITLEGLKSSFVNEPETIICNTIATAETVQVVSKYIPGKVYETTRIVMYGDVNCDGEVTVQDYSAAVNMGLEDEDPGFFSPVHYAVDVNGDDVIDALDCRIIKLMAMNKY